jgi:hypothetical protein
MAVVLLVLQEIVESRVQKKRQFKFGVMNKLAQFLFDSMKQIIGAISDL